MRERLKRAGRAFVPSGAASGLAPLEERCMPTAGMLGRLRTVLAPQVQVIRAGNGLVINGAGTFTVETRLNPVTTRGRITPAAATNPMVTGMVRVTSPNARPLQVRADKIASITINGSAGNDVISVVGRSSNVRILINPRGGHDQINSQVPATVPSDPVSPSPTPTPTPSPTPTPTPLPTPTPTPSPTPTPTPAPSPLEQMVQQIITLTNQERAAQGLQSLSADPLLTQAAVIQTANMVTAGTMSHELDQFTGQATLTQRLNYVGYRYAGAAENIGYGATSAAQIVDLWMNSAGHRANILNASYTSIGVAVQADQWGALYFTQVFGKPRS